jgi:hypothetical protein
MNETIKREVRVSFSKKAQPVWFRIVKWVVFLSVTAALWNTNYLGWWLVLLTVVTLILHFTWRYKTKGWTQPWGGWNDIEAAHPLKGTYGK